MSAAIPRKHHYISKCYLKAFADVKPNKKGRYLKVIDLENASTFEANIEDCAAKRDFNRYEGIGDEQALEHSIADIENEVGPVLDELRDSRQLTHERIDASICFMTMYYSRNLPGRENLENFVAGVLQQYRLTEGGLELPETLPSQNRLIQLELEQIPVVSGHLKMRHWKLLDSSSVSEEFVTSNSPVTLFSDNDQSSTFWGIDLQTSRTVVFFPISPTLALYGTLEDTTTPLVTLDLVAKLNNHTVEGRGTQLYYRDDFKVRKPDGNIVDSSVVLSKSILNKCARS